MPARLSSFAFGVLLAALGSLLPGAGLAQDDAALYYRRTHEGALPPAGFTTSDHSDEAAATYPAAKLVPVIRSSLLDGGIDPANLGKGDWIWQIPNCISALGVGNVQGLIDYEKNRGMKWITVKCGNGGSVWTQFNADLVTRAHAAGLKIFGWAYMYGNDMQGEINVALNALALGADGFIIDAETEYETLSTNDQAATTFCQAVKAAYPNRFLAHAPFPIITAHSGFPYVAFGKYCDAVMPQAYWADIGGTNYAITMVTRMNTEWRNWQNSLTGANTNAIKPIIPIGQAYNSVNGTVTGSQIAQFINAMKTNTPATAGGYTGVSFWSCQHHSTDMWNAIQAIEIGVDPNIPAVTAPPRPRSVDPGTNVTFSVTATGAATLKYQWRFNGTNIAGATNATYTRTNVQVATAGDYSVAVTNTYGGTTSGVARLVVNTPPPWQVTFSETFETNNSTGWNLFQGSGNAVSDYTVDWSYDYGALAYVMNGVTNFIPPAPNSGGTTRGVKLTVNKNNAVAAPAGVSLYPKDVNLTGDYAIRCDVWLNYNGVAGGSDGSTEFASVGINHTGTRVNWGSAAAVSSDGLWFAWDGEGGTTSDYRAYTGIPVGAALQLTIDQAGLDANGATSDDSADAFYQALFPSPAFESAGAPGKRWVQCEVSQLADVITWRLNGIVVAQRMNTTDYTNGTPMIGYMDLFNSIPAPTNETFVIFDNVRVLTPAIPPIIVAHPTNRTVNTGANAAFTVAADGAAPITYQWRLNGSPVANGTNSSLTLTNISATQAGNYSVAVSNSSGGLISSNAALNVVTFKANSFLKTNGFWRLSFSGVPGGGYTIEASTNLSTWQVIATFPNSSGTVNYPIAVSNSPQVFYRVGAPR